MTWFRSSRLYFCFAATAVLVSSLATPAQAASSNFYYFVENGVHYKNQNGLDESHYVETAVAYNGNSSTTFQTGWFEARPIVYFAYNDQLCQTGAWVANSSPTDSHVTAGVHSCAGSLHYARGQTSVRSMNGRNTFTSLRTPTVSDGSARGARGAAEDVPPGAPIFLAKDDFPVNGAGQTYGSSAEADNWETDAPDLIGSINPDGVSGYVLKADVMGDATSIPLYDLDGVTVLGEFPLTM